MKKVFVTTALMLAGLTTFAQMPASSAPASTILTVEAKNFASSEGMAYVVLLDKEENAVKRITVPIHDRQVQYSFNGLPAGVYAVKLYHDTNNNKVLDKGLFGIPKESWGCSNNVKASFGPPSFARMLFELKNSRNVSITMN